MAELDLWRTPGDHKQGPTPWNPFLPKSTTELVFHTSGGKTTDHGDVP
jgi:hypothetical protein